MKIITDRLYTPMQCAATRITKGSVLVIPFISSKIPFERFAKKTRKFLVPAIILAPIVAAFTEPRIMFVLVPLWVVMAYKLGACQHCRKSHEDVTGGFVPVSHGAGDQ